LIARVFSLEWGLYFKRGQVKPVPRGSVYSVTTARTEFAMLILAHQDEFMETATRFYIRLRFLIVSIASIDIWRHTRHLIWRHVW